METLLRKQPAVVSLPTAVVRLHTLTEMAIHPQFKQAIATVIVALEETQRDNEVLRAALFGELKG